MDINVPLILFLLVAGTGVVTLVDRVLWAGKRKAAIAKVQESFSELTEEQKEEDKKYQAAIATASAEPSYVEISKSFFPLLALVFVVRSFIIEPFQIPSESMVPTLEVGDFIAVNKFTYGVRLPILRTKVLDINDPERGDVMVFFPPNEKRYFIKRVIGLPGDKVRIQNNRLFINGVEVPREHVSDVIPTNPGEFCFSVGGVYKVMEETIDGKKHIMRNCSTPSSAGLAYSSVVPEGHYFMMGDNRDNSGDSRKFGMVPEERIVGKAFVIWMHWDKFLSIPSFSRVGSI